VGVRRRELVDACGCLASASIAQGSRLVPRLHVRPEAGHGHDIALQPIAGAYLTSGYVPHDRERASHGRAARDYTTEQLRELFGDVTGEGPG
jgi:hypothetical protein